MTSSIVSTARFQRSGCSTTPVMTLPWKAKLASTKRFERYGAAASARWKACQALRGGQRRARIDSRDLRNSSFLNHNHVLETSKIGVRQKPAPWERRGLLKG